MKSDKLLAAEVLEAASMVVAVPDWWAQRCTAFACKTKEGDGYNQVGVENPAAMCFCAVGAIAAAAYELAAGKRIEIQSLARKYAGYQAPDVGLTMWNDQHQRTPRQVAHLLWRAAQELRSEHN